MQNRFLSNVIVLAVCVAGFSGIAFALNFFSYNETEVEQEFSFERRAADRLFHEQNWEGSARYYKQLISVDPGNGGAVFRYAECLGHRRRPFLRSIGLQLRSDSPNQKIIEESIAKANEIAEEVIPAYEAALAFPRHRNEARFRLALLHALRNEKRQAIDYLVAADRDNHKPHRSISHYYQFQRLLDEPEIQAILPSNIPR